MEGFGQTVASTASSTNPYMYGATSGYRNDNDAGLTLVGARYYDSQVGRLITNDIYLDECPYLYCDHDPVNNIDPTGHIGEGAVDWIFDRLDNIVGKLPKGSGAVAVRGIFIFAPIWYGGIQAVRKYKKNWKGKVTKPGSLGYENGGTRKSQRIMQEKWGDPDQTDE